MKIILDSPAEKAFHLPPIVTLTWYKGCAEKAKDYLQARSRTVLDQNPWLGGAISKENGNYVLQSNATAADVEIKVISQPSLGRSTPVNEIHSHVCDNIVVNKQRLWQITLIDNGADYFALLFAVSHDIADAYVYYRLLIMLCGSEIESLRIDRAITEAEQSHILG